MKTLKILKKINFCFSRPIFKTFCQNNEKFREKKGLLPRKNQLPFPVETFTKVHSHSRGQQSDHLLRFISILEADIRFRYQGFTQETSQLLKKYKNYSHLTSIPGGAGVTSGKKQLTAGSGVGIY